MGIKYQALKGMDDLLPGEIEKWQWLEEKARIFLEAQGYREIRTPLVEPAELFTRSLGEGSDIVHKEMYVFQDRGGREVALRPEMTASVARAVLENHLLKQTRSLRLYYLGPMFRGERPQAGRKRQFHQIGIELINEGGPEADEEVVVLLWEFLKFVGLDRMTLRLNHLGCPKDRPQLVASLREYFSRQRQGLCPDCLYRLEKNVLRIFDCKNARCQPVIEKAPWEDWCEACRENFDQILNLLKQHDKIPFEFERRLVRGIDYYTGLVFEVVSSGLGAQDAVAGGGRYDGLYESLGGTAAPATGFSIGVERLMQGLEATRADAFQEIESRRIYLAILGSDSSLRSAAQHSMLELRQAGFRIETIPKESSLSAHLKRANQLGIRRVIIFGEDELRKQKVALKDLEKRTQTELDLKELVSHLKVDVP